MGTSRRLALAALLLTAVAAAPAAVAQESCDPLLTFSELKSTSEGLVQQALGTLPNSSLNGTFNRFSALFQRGPVQDLCIDDEDQLPESFLKGRDAAALDLLDDLQAAVDAFELETATCGGEGQMDCAEAQFVILQLVAHVVFERHVDLYDDELRTACICIDCEPGDDFEWCHPDGLKTLRDVADLIAGAGWFEDANAAMDAAGIPGPAVQPPSTGDVGGIRNFRDAAVQLVERAIGVPWIDYGRITGIESIDD